MKLSCFMLSRVLSMSIDEIYIHSPCGAAKVLLVRYYEINVRYID